MTPPMTMEQAQVDWPLPCREVTQMRVKAEFKALDALSRKRALTETESRAMERAMNRLDEWGVAA